MSHRCRLSPVLGLASMLWLASPTASYTWPDKGVDILESILYQQNGYRQYGLAHGVFPCNNNANTPETGRFDASEWLRTAYHDVATADVNAGTGGLDASIGFESDRDENKGKAVNETLGFLIGFTSPRSSMADLIALGAQLSVGSCSDGKVDIPFRGGRVDALEPGPEGVPKPEETLETHTTMFERQGFSATEMIGLVACGHTLGGVHGSNFPEIVPELDDPENSASRHDFDGTFDNFDNSVAKQFVANDTQNPLAFGHNETTRSDFRIFTSDGGDMIHQMAESEDFFFETCTQLFERMLNTVPKGSELTDVIAPIAVKPYALEIVINSNGTMMAKGEVRIIDDGATDREVLIHMKARDGTPMSTPISAYTLNGLEAEGLYGDMPSFRTYMFNTTVSTKQGVSAFDVEIKTSGTSTLETNGGAGFPFEDAIVPQSESTCRRLAFDDTGYVSNNTIEVTAAVRDDLNANVVNLIVQQPINMANTLAARFEEKTVEMKKSRVLNGGYSLYTGKFWFTVANVGPMKTFDLVASGPEVSKSNTFFRWNDFSSCPIN